MINKHWFWSWEIYFDDSVKNDVVNFVGGLTKKEQKMYKFMLEFFSGFYTFQMLIDYIKNILSI